MVDFPSLAINVFSIHTFFKGVKWLSLVKPKKNLIYVNLVEELWLNSLVEDKCIKMFVQGKIFRISAKNLIKYTRTEYNIRVVVKG